MGEKVRYVKLHGKNIGHSRVEFNISAHRRFKFATGVQWLIITESAQPKPE